MKKSMQLNSNWNSKKWAIQRNISSIRYTGPESTIHLAFLTWGLFCSINHFLKILVCWEIHTLMRGLSTAHSQVWPLAPTLVPFFYFFLPRTLGSSPLMFILFFLSLLECTFHADRDLYLPFSLVNPNLHNSA